MLAEVVVQQHELWLRVAPVLQQVALQPAWQPAVKSCCSRLVWLQVEPVEVGLRQHAAPSCFWPPGGQISGLDSPSGFLVRAFSLAFPQLSSPRWLRVCSWQQLEVLYPCVHNASKWRMRLYDAISSDGHGLRFLGSILDTVHVIVLSFCVHTIFEHSRRVRRECTTSSGRKEKYRTS